MKLILFSGDHPRHLFVNKEVLKFFDEIFVVVMQREELLRVPPSELNDHDKKMNLYITHIIYIFVTSI